MGTKQGTKRRPAPAKTWKERELPALGIPDAAPEPAELGTFLRAYRYFRGESLRELATRTGVPFTTLGRIETGRNEMSLSHYLRLVKFFRAEMEGNK